MGGVAMLSRVAFALVILLLAAVRGAAAADLTFDQTARILAGLEASTAGLPPASARLVPAYSRLVATSWSTYTSRIGGPMRDWARGQLGDSRDVTIFYPFSGPDFATVAQLYADASRYILVAIQPAGEPPALGQLSPQELAAFLALFRGGWERFASMGFFLTKSLDEDAGRSGNRIGVTAPLMVFAARAGFEVMAVQPVRIADDGTGLEPHPGDRGNRRTWGSVRLTLARDGRQVILDYVQLDLSDVALLKHPARRAWLESVAGNPTVLKAASHLPQNGGFTIVRDAILGGAPSVWQDETGIDHGLLAKRFTVTLYGRFTRPHHLFGAGAQRSLALAYERAGAEAKPLAFRVGYLKESGWSVQFAVRDAAGIPMRGEPPMREVGAAARVAAPPLEHRIALLEAHVKEQLSLAKARPRKVFIGGSTGEAPYADYVNQVRGRIAHAPDLAAAGNLRAIVSMAIASDGNLQSVELDRTSGSPALDLALRKAALSAAPFPPLPQAVRERADVLVVTLQLPDRAGAIDSTSVAATAQSSANPCELPFREMVDPRAAKSHASGSSSTGSGVSHFRMIDALNTLPEISPEDDRRYNYRSRYLVADLNTHDSGGQCKGLEERYPLIDPARPDYDIFPELQDPETLENFVRNVQGIERGRGYFEAPASKKPVVRMGGASYCIGQTVSLCEIRQGRSIEIARLGTSGLLSNSGPARHFYVPMNTIVLKSWMENRRYTSADARRDASLGGISESERSGVRLSQYLPEDTAWVMPNFMQWLPVDGFARENSIKGLHELSRGETRINNLGSPVSHGCFRLTRYGAVLTRWWTPRGAKLFIHYTENAYRQTP